MAPVTKNYDYLVIGGGSGGSGGARRASGWYKAKTAIVDAGISGGCCVNVGSDKHPHRKQCSNYLTLWADVYRRK
jgi:choline dehydrogenase-like flavoprotein